MKKLLLLIYLLGIPLIAQQSYYDDVDLTKTGIDLKNELSTKITNTHTNELSYSEAREALKIIDLVPGQGDDVFLLYGFSNSTCPTNSSDDNDHRTRDKASFGGGSTCEWNREHTYPKSLGTPNLGESGPGSDAHHLRACDVQRNSSRGSLLFADGSGNSGSTGGGWYPGDEWKGDVARIMMYMYLRYGNRCLPINVGNGTTNTVDSNMINLFLEWNEEDPVSEYEDQRNTYLSDLTKTYGQGNRNPFIDNPNLATQIWGGPVAEDRWNITPDTENPAAPSNLTVSNITNTTAELNWTAATDNVAVTEYEIFVDGSLYDTANTNSKVITGLTLNTEYDAIIYAKDAAGNTSLGSNTETFTTDNFIDVDPPSAITDLAASNTTHESTELNWTASTDNVAITEYDIFQNGSNIATVSTNSYNVTNLAAESTYDFTVYAKDAAGNTSAVSNTESITTLEQPSGASDLFISEYVEGGGFNKAIEIANFTGASVNLSSYALARQSAGSGNWEPDPIYQLSGTINSGDVFVIINSDAADSHLQSEKDAEINNIAPMTFNGNDPVGLFKNGTLIDIVGTYNGGSANFAKDQTLRRVPSVSSPRTDFTPSEWNVFAKDVTADIGSHNVTLSTLSFEKTLFQVYPNPSNTDSVSLKFSGNRLVSTIELYNTFGQKTKSIKNPEINNGVYVIHQIPSGFYMLKVISDNVYSVKKLIVD